LLKNSAGTVKDPGVRIITDNTNIAFGFVNLEFFPAATAVTVAGDHLVAIQPPNPVGAPIQDLIRECSITLTPNAAAKVVPAVGNSTTKINPARIFSVMRSYGRRLSNIERRRG
jgi:hypothetical protein